MSYLWVSALVVGLVCGGLDIEQATTAQAALTALTPETCAQLAAAAQEAQAAAAQRQGKPAKPRPPEVRSLPRQEQEAERAEEEIELPTGPMRLAPHALVESRVRHFDQTPHPPDQATLRLQATLTGERLKDIVGLGRLVIEEAVDDTGKVLASPENIKRRDRVATSPYRVTKRVLRTGFITVFAELPAPAREARKLVKVSGWIKLVYGGETEDILIDNPLQYLGGYIDHPRLRELNMKVKVIEPGDEIDEARDGRGIALEFERCAKQVRNTAFYDAWLRPMYPRARRVERPDGRDYMYYGVMPGIAPVDEDMQMILTVWPQVEEETVRFTFENLELP